MNTNRVSVSAPYKSTAVIVGIMFILGTVCGILSGVVTVPISSAPTFPLNVAANATQWIIGALLVMGMGLSLAMMPVMLYPVFAKHDQVLALGAVLFRGAIEAISYALMVICMLLVLTVSEIPATAGVASAANLQALGSTIVACKNWTEMWGAIIFTIGGLMIYALFFKTRLVPRWLSGWGLAAGVLYIAANLLAMFGPLHMPPSIGEGVGLLLVPTALQEMVFALWLIVKGFNPGAAASLAANKARYELVSAT